MKFEYPQRFQPIEKVSFWDDIKWRVKNFFVKKYCTKCKEELGPVYYGDCICKKCFKKDQKEKTALYNKWSEVSFNPSATGFKVTRIDDE